MKLPYFWVQLFSFDYAASSFRAKVANSIAIMNVLIVEDEELSAGRLQKLILGIDPTIRVLATYIQLCGSIYFTEAAALSNFG